MSRKRVKNNNFYVAIAVLLVLIVIFAIVRRDNVVVQSEQTQVVSVTAKPLKTYHSDFLKITFDYPESYIVEEEFGAINLKKETDKISILKNGTNHSSLERYLEDVQVKNRSVITNKQNMNINGLSAIEANINDNKYYLVYKDNWVFSLWTSSLNLYSDLDQIARSFRYQP